MYEVRKDCHDDQPTDYIVIYYLLEESASSEGDEALSNMSTPTHGSVASVDGASRRARMTKRMARQAQLKR